MKIDNAILKTIFTQTAFNHFFELHIAAMHRSGLIKIPIYLSLGTEHIPPCVAATDINFMVFPQHRCHSYYLSAGGSPLGLMKELLSKPDGCNHGFGGSASVSIPGKLWGHDGLLGSNAPIGVGYAHASQKPTMVVLGDAAVEEDYALGALGFAASRKCPVLFLVEDNDLSILTPVSVRRTWNIVEVAQGFGIPSLEMADDPHEIYHNVRILSRQLPALLQIKCCRHLWHAGSGTDGKPLWDRYRIFKKQTRDAGEIEKIAQAEVERIANEC